MRVAVAFTAIFLIISSAAQAEFTDFSDYTQTREFATDEVFSSFDISFKAVERLPIPNRVRVFPSFDSAKLYVGPGVEFVLPPNTLEVSLRYHDGAGSRIAINGVEPAAYPGQGGIPFHVGFSFLDGQSLGGVVISTVLTTTIPSIEDGMLHLRGPINSLTIAGLELFIDDVLVRVPEPSAAALLLTSASAVTVARRRPNR